MPPADLVITPTGPGNSPGNKVTMKHGIHRITGFGTGTYKGFAYFGHFQSLPDSPWGKIAIAGVDGVYAKYWGKKPLAWLVKGAMVSRNPDVGIAETDLGTFMNDLRALQGNTEVDITGPLNLTRCIIDTIVPELLESTGGRQVFTILGIRPEGG